MKKNINQFTENEITLRLIELNDLEHTLQWRNNESYRIWFNTTYIINASEHFTWFEQYLARENDFIFIVNDEQKNRIGQLSIYHVDWQNMQGEFGRFLVNPQFEGQGLMKKSCRAALSLAQKIFSLKKLYLEVKLDNMRAIYIYQKCGFVETERDSKQMKMEVLL